MAKVIFTVSYEIKPEMREQYLALAKDMQSYLAGTKGKNYGIYEEKTRKNAFSEIFICASMEEYDRLEDDQDDTTHEMINKLEQYLASSKMEFSTLYGIE